MRTQFSMSRAQFLEMNQKHPEVSNWMVKVLSQRLDATNVATFRDLKEKNRQLQTAYDELKAAQAQITRDTLEASGSSPNSTPSSHNHSNAGADE